MVQPAARAGAAFRVTMAAGKFQGVIPAVTPMGSLVTRTRASRRCERDDVAIDASSFVGEPVGELGGDGRFCFGFPDGFAHLYEP